jgi:acetolactate synthase-1/2/3 large subunit
LHANGFRVLRWFVKRVDDPAADAAPGQFDRGGQSDGASAGDQHLRLWGDGHSRDYAARMSIEAPVTVNAGHLVARRLRASGIDTIFTLSGGHLFPIYDGCRAEGIRLIDTRHEQTAAFAAEGWSKVTRVPGVAALTAGPGVTNGMSAMAAAQQNQSPLVVLGGRAPAMRWGQGSLQEIDHVPFVAPLTRFAATAGSPDAVGSLVDDALRAAIGAPSGVAFVDFPMDVVFGEAPDAAAPGALAQSPPSAQADTNALDHAVRLLAGAQRPVIMAGTNVWWGHAEHALLSLAETLRIPVLMNGMARGTVPADHSLAFSRARSKALSEADVALVIGVPMDFRLGFGAVFGAETKMITADRVAPGRPHPREVAAGLYGDLPAILAALSGASAADHEAWIGDLRAVEAAARAGEAAELSDDRTPLHPMRVYAELSALLDRDAIVVIDAGDFGSYAGRVIDSYVPGAWLDSGPFGCLGSGPGYALAAKLARPDRQVVLLQGDGAFGFSGMEWDTLVRHGVQVVSVIGNNGIWALEKHPMEQLYGYSVVAELRPGTRYDQVVAALGGHGELVSTPSELRPALDRAFSSGLPAVVNALTDPTVAYPRRSNLA